MLRTQTTTTDPADGREILVPPELRAGVGRANRVLETELLPSLDFDIDAHWRFVRRAGDRVAVLLDLTTSHEGNRVGITGYPLDADAFVDDTRIRTSLDRPTWNFTTLLSYVNRMEMKHDRERLQDSLLAGVD